MAAQVTMTSAEWRAMSDAEKKAKYGNRKVRAADGVFDSQREYGHWLLLKDRESNKEIRNLQRQVTYLIEVNGVKVCKYVADFIYEEQHHAKAILGKPRPDYAPGWKVTVADSKGFKTEGYRLKKALMLAVHGVKIHEM